MLYRRAIVVMFLAALLHAPAAFAQFQNCFQCKMIIYSDGREQMYCATPPALIYGREYCAIDEIGPDTWFCQTWGDQCCNDPV